MKFQINTSILHADDEAEKWIVETTIMEGGEGEPVRRDNFKVYIDVDSIEVTPIPINDFRSVFGWKDWAFDNIRGNIEAAAALATLAVFADEDQYGAVIQARYPEPARPKVVDMLDEDQ